jgi:hypothetical protein
MDETLPNAQSARSPHERENLRRVVSQRGLCGLANDTKWDEFIAAIRARSEWRPSYRFKCIDGPPSDWDVEWFYHLPLPLLSIEWLDVAHLQEVSKPCLPARVNVIDHSGWIEELLRRIGLDYSKGTTMIRIFGYSPRSTELFDR